MSNNEKNVKDNTKKEIKEEAKKEVKLKKKISNLEKKKIKEINSQIKKEKKENVISYNKKKKDEATNIKSSIKRQKEELKIINDDIRKSKKSLKRPVNKDYVYSYGEEVANATTHGPMAFMCLCLLPFSAIWAYLNGGEHRIIAAISVSIFVISIFLMFLASTLYHTMKLDTNQRKVFHILDHIFIYVAIAGSYTPIALYIIGGWQGIVIASIQWAMVIFGILYKSLVKQSIPKVSLTIYLVMGWTIVFFLPLFLKNANVVLMSLIAGGGIFYSIGSVFYAMKNFKYHHMIWHLMINLGAIAHFIGIVFFMY